MTRKMSLLISCTWMNCEIISKETAAVHTELVSAQLQIVSSIAFFPSQFAHAADFPARDGRKHIEIRPD